MAADKLKYAIGNSSSTTLSGSVANDATTMTITSDTNFAAKEGEGMIIVDEGTATEEFAYSTGKTGTTLTTPLANRGLEGGEAKAHDANATVKGIITATMWNDVIDSLANVVSKTTGALDTTKTVDLTTEQTLTNKTLTSPVINGAVTGTMTPPLTFFGTNFIAPEGFLLNGKIVPSVANNDLTVALKGLDGNDPSATNPVYCRIGDTVHAITAALSVTKADGTNWFNAGSAELATKEIDYFVYLGYNATDGVVIGFSRIPYVTQYDQFSATSTNEKYCAISTISNAAAGDVYTVIGRFAATLSAGAGYTWSVPTFTAINLIQRPIFETRLLTWQPVYTCSGSLTFTSVTTSVAEYRISGGSIFINVSSTGTTGGTTSYSINASIPMSSTSSHMSGGVHSDGATSYTPLYTEIYGANISWVKTALAGWGLGTGRYISGSMDASIA
jgi:hypothetical protein